MQFIINSNAIEVKILRKKIKNLYIRVKDNKIIVSANAFTSDKYILDLLEKNRSSIEKMFLKQENQKLNQVYYLGNELKFTFSDKVIINENECFGPSIDYVNEYLEKNSYSVFASRIERLKNMFQDLPEFTLKLRKMKTRWGVCNKKSMTVTLNTLLIHKDVSLIDYVIIHELCHFKHMNHSESFWKEVEKYYPYYKQARKMLRG